MSFLSSIPIWGWIDIFSNVVVFVALCGESHWALKWLIPNKSIGKTSVKWRREKLKKKFEFLLILGIAGEVGCLPLSIYESSATNLEAKQAEVVAGQANERAANIESNNLVLHTKVLELEAKSRWRTITPEQEKAFIELTKNILKLPIRVRMEDGSSAEVKSFSQRIRTVLDKAGFVETNKDQSIAEWPPEMNVLWTGIGPELPPIIFVSNPALPGKIIDLRDAQEKLKTYASYATNTFVKTEFEFVGDDSTPKAFVRDENGSPVLHIKVTDRAVVQIPAFGAVQNAFNAIGLTTGNMTSTNIPIGAFEIFVNQK
jgi:hypothetical protein